MNEKASNGHFPIYMILLQTPYRNVQKSQLPLSLEKNSALFFVQNFHVMVLTYLV